MEIEGSLPPSQQPATYPYPEINPVHAPISLPEDPYSYYHSIYTWFFQVFSLPQDCSQNQAGIKITKIINITVLWDMALQLA
jgi:hypothetical protein